MAQLVLVDGQYVLELDPDEAKGLKDKGLALVSVSRPKPVNTFYQNVIVGKRDDRIARKRLAAQMRAEGIEPNGPAWAAAKKKAGIR